MGGIGGVQRRGLERRILGEPIRERLCDPTVPGRIPVGVGAEEVRISLLPPAQYPVGVETGRRVFVALDVERSDRRARVGWAAPHAPGERAAERRSTASTKKRW